MKISEYVSKYDPQNQFEVLVNTYKQIEFAWSNSFNLSSLKDKKFSNIIVTGLGGSAISGDLLQNYLRDELKYPYTVNRNYSLPAFADDKTLLIVSSYSGNTEETISVFKQAIERKCNIICVTTGGEAEKIALENNVPVVKVQKGFQPRYSLGLSFFSLLKIFQELGIVDNQDSVTNKIISLWKNKGVEYSQEGNYAYKLAEGLLGHIPIIYSAADITSAAGYRMKCQFNENSKLHAFHNVIPELNHNEIIGWETYSESQLRGKLITILDSEYHPQVKRRFEITSELASAMKIDVVNLKSDEEDFKSRLMDLIYLGDWVTYYCAVLRNLDPTEIENINILKERLKNTLD